MGTGNRPTSPPNSRHNNRHNRSHNTNMHTSRHLTNRISSHPSRSRLTTYADLIAYLRAVESLGMPSDPATAPLPLRRRDLLSQCDGLLQLLGWDAQRGRRFLEEQFGRGSRQQLSDDELLRFNMLLESAMLEQAAS